VILRRPRRAANVDLTQGTRAAFPALPAFPTRSADMSILLASAQRAGTLPVRE
jgi:hypothetical protein